MGNQFLSQPPLLSTCTICQLERFTLHRWKTVLLVLFTPRRCRAVCSRVCESSSEGKRKLSSLRRKVTSFLSLDLIRRQEIHTASVSSLLVQTPVGMFFWQQKKPMEHAILH